VGVCGADWEEFSDEVLAGMTWRREAVGKGAFSGTLVGRIMMCILCIEKGNDIKSIVVLHYL
jgi:hypothetical protein